MLKNYRRISANIGDSSPTFAGMKIGEHWRTLENVGEHGIVLNSSE
jgi:hypothetical protein